MGKKGHNFFFTKAIIKILRVEGGICPPLNPLPPSLGAAFVVVFTVCLLSVRRR
jgi:hypothetical protein